MESIFNSVFIFLTNCLFFCLAFIFLKNIEYEIKNRLTFKNHQRHGKSNMD